MLSWAFDVHIDVYSYYPYWGSVPDDNSWVIYCFLKHADFGEILKDLPPPPDKNPGYATVLDPCIPMDTYTQVCINVYL